MTRPSISMNGSYLLDTNIVIAVFASEAETLRRLGEAAAIYVPIIVLGELYYGARKSARVTRPSLPSIPIGNSGIARLRVDAPPPHPMLGHPWSDLWTGGRRGGPNPSTRRRPIRLRRLRLKISNPSP